MNKVYFFLLNKKISDKIILFLIFCFLFLTFLILFNLSSRIPNWVVYSQGVAGSFYFMCGIISIYLIPIIKQRILIYVSLFTFIYSISGTILIFDFFGAHSYVIYRYIDISKDFYNTSLIFKNIIIIMWAFRTCALNLLFREFITNHHHKNKVFYRFNLIIIILTALFIMTDIYIKYKNYIFLYYAVFFSFVQLYIFVKYIKIKIILFTLSFVFIFLSIILSVINTMRVFNVDLFSQSLAYKYLLYSKYSYIITGNLVLFNIIILTIISFKYIENKNKSLLHSIHNSRKVIYETQLNAASFEINMLTAAIKPHFLFNCLNSIEILISINPAKAEESIYNLAYFYKYFIAHINGELVCFQDELLFTERYVKMENVRFNDIIFLFVQTESNLQFKIPPFSLQLLVENAIVHCITKSKQSGEILIQVKKINNHYRINISNKKNNPQEENSYKKKGSGMGLKILAQRLNLCFGKNNTDIFIEDTESQYSVSFSVPIMKDDC